MTTMDMSLEQAAMLLAREFPYSTVECLRLLRACDNDLRIARRVAAVYAQGGWKSLEAPILTLEHDQRERKRERERAERSMIPRSKRSSELTATIKAVRNAAASAVGAAERSKVESVKADLLDQAIVLHELADDLLVQGLPAERASEDTRLLNLLERGCWQIDYEDYEGNLRELSEIVGSVNDREWKTRGTGPTVRGCLRMALAAGQ